MKQTMKYKIAMFFSNSCEPCQKQRPIVEKIAKKYKIPVEYVSVDNNEGFQHAQKFGVKGWPHVFFIVDNIIKEEQIGFDLQRGLPENENRFENNLKNAFKL